MAGLDEVVEVIDDDNDDDDDDVDPFPYDAPPHPQTWLELMRLLRFLMVMMMSICHFL